MVVVQGRSWSRSLLSVEDAGAEPIAEAESWIQVYSMVPRHHTEDASGTRNDLLSTCDRARVVPSLPVL